MFQPRNLLLLLTACLCFCASSLRAADPIKNLAPVYRHWIVEEVPYIISSEERAEFIALKSDQERDQYIQAFWQARNPNPGADFNTYKEEHYRRLAYANQQFGSTELQNGWRTDQGRVYITLGAPQQIVTYPNARNVRPLIIWFYQSPTPALPTHFNVMFYKRSSGDPYTLYSPYQDGPTRLTTGLEDLNVPTRSIQTIRKSLGDEVARTSLSLIPTEPVNLNAYEPSLSSDVLLSTIRGLADNSMNRDTIELRRHRELSTSRVLTSTLTNNATHAALQDFQTLVVPDLSSQPWDMSRILAFTQPSGTVEEGKSPFSISGIRFAPRGTGSVSIHPSEPLWIAFQMWATPVDAKGGSSGVRSHRLKITYSYGNVQSGASPQTEEEEIEGSDFDASGNLLTGHKIDTSKLEGGSYRLVVTVLDEQTNLKAFGSINFHVVPWSEQIELWTAHFSEAAGERSDAIDDYKRGLSALAQSQNDLAAKWFDASLADDAAYLPALDRLVDLLSRADRFSDVVELSKKHPVTQELKEQTAILMAEANSKIGQPQAGSRILEAELQFKSPDPELYRALSKLYLAGNDPSRAAEFEQKAAGLKH